MIGAGDTTPYLKAVENGNISPEMRQAAIDAELVDDTRMEMAMEKVLVRESRPSIIAVIGIGQKTGEVLFDLFFAEGFSPDTALAKLKSSIVGRKAASQ